MRFVVPKFIEREMKIFGPLTLRIFIILLVFVGIFVLLYFNLPKKVFYILLIVLTPLFILLFFVNIDGVPLYQLLPSIFSFLFSPKIFVWKGKGYFEELKFKREREIPLERKKGKLNQVQVLVKTKK